MSCRDRDEDGPDTLSEDEEEDDTGEVTSEEGKTDPPQPSLFSPLFSFRNMTLFNAF